MNNIIYTICIILGAIGQSFSQRFGNEWIVNGQQYMKMVVDTKGVYKIEKSDLDAAGFSTNGKSLKNYQLFFRGVEMKINVVGNPDSNFGPNDYIEFYAMENDGKQDEELYKPKTARPHNYYSLFSSETSYFLTAGSTLGKRMADGPPSAAIPPESYYLQKILHVPATDWIFDITKSGVPALIQSYYEPSESMVSTRYWGLFTAMPADSVSVPYKADILLSNYLAGTGVDTKFESMVASRRPEGKIIHYDLGNGVAGDVSLSGFFDVKKIEANIPTITNSNIPVNMNATGVANRDFWSYFYTLATYPSLPIYRNDNEYYLRANANGTSHLQLSGAPASIFGYEITDIYNQNKLNLSINSGNLDVIISNTATSKKIWLSALTKKPKRSSAFVFGTIDRSLYDYLVITDTRTVAGANEYKFYRETAAGGNYKVLVSETQKLYDQFSYGERNPIAIRRFCDYMTDTPKVIKYLFLIGKSISQTNMLKTHELEDFVPTYGFPGSDILFTSGLLGKPETISSIATGRLVVTTNKEITDYVAKVIEHETRVDPVWQKNLLHIVGPKTGGTDGTNGGEFVSLFNTMEGIRATAINSPFMASNTNYVTLNKPISAWNNTTKLYKELPVPLDFYTKINAGVGILAYYGHGTSTSTSYNIGYVSTQIPSGVGGPLYTNKGKYPVLLAFGCGISDSFFGEKDIAADWVNTPNKGAINAISMSYLSYESYDTRNMQFLYNTWFGNLPSARKSANGKSQAPTSMVESAIGDIVKQASINHLAAFPNGNPSAAFPDYYFIANLQQTMLLGDPSIGVFKMPYNPQPLSLTLLDVEVKASNLDKKNIINWETQTEVDFTGFEIERSVDSNSFDKIGFVKGLNNKNEYSKYVFDDTAPTEGINYYRLKMINNDGKFTYSKIVSAYFESLDNKLSILGNPITENNIKFQINSYLDGSAKLFDLNGKQISVGISSLNSNTYKVTIADKLPKGTYILKINNKKGKSFSEKIVFD
ncbi:MAG: C25 family cysteine peptidase [Bacteroidota bacterium]